MKRLSILGTAALFSLVVSSAAMASSETFVAQLQPTVGNEGKHGEVTFELIDNKVKVTVHIEGLPAKSTHGFHVHEFGDCRAADATSAGGHYNPDNNPHGGPDHKKRHMGDLGNVQTDAQGKVDFVHLDHILSMQGEDSILGRAVIVHAQADDLTSQPVGNAGARVLCGVIGKTK